VLSTPPIAHFVPLDNSITQLFNYSITTYYHTYYYTTMRKAIFTTTLLIASTNAFTTTTSTSSTTIATTTTTPAPIVSSLNAVSKNNDNDNEGVVSERRTFLRNIAGVAFGVGTSTIGVGSLGGIQPASASYSAYSNREKDWQERKETGDIQFSTSKDLKRQLQEVAPMNVAKSQVFCPNGPSSAVSPLMENKCNDMEAMPSVFGRSDDIMGNSIPGRTKNPAYTVGGSSSLSAEAGGFPSYGKK
jgi:hypothetical protein